MPSKEKSLKYFGIDLSDLAARTKKCIPDLIVKCTNIILLKGREVEGIFRINGNLKLVEKLKQSYDRNGDADLSAVDDIISIASLLKLFLRDLPSSLISVEMTQKFIAIHEDSKYMLESLKETLSTLNIHNYITLKYIIAFLALLSSRNETTKMTASALSSIFGPNIFRTSPGYIGLKEQGLTNYVTLQFIQKYNQIFLLNSETALFDPSFTMEKLQTDLEAFLKLNETGIVLQSNLNNNVIDVIVKNKNYDEELEDRMIAKHNKILDTINVVISKFIFLDEECKFSDDNSDIDILSDEIKSDTQFGSNKAGSPLNEDVFNIHSLKSLKSKGSDTNWSVESKDSKKLDEFLRKKTVSPKRSKQKEMMEGKSNFDEKLSHIEGTLSSLMAFLKDKRFQAGRPDDPESMTRQQLMEEKLCVQKALLKYENLHGRPNSEEVKNIMLPLYDHYRIVKRIINNNPQANRIIGEQMPSGVMNQDHLDLDIYDMPENMDTNFDKLSMSQLISEFEKTKLKKKKVPTATLR